MGRAGFTLFELLVVVVILAAAAGLAVLLVGDVTGEARRDTTEVSLVRIRTAILGAAESPGYLGDTGAHPQRLVDLLVKPASLEAYDPVRRLGWRGPYLRSGTGRYTVDASRGFPDRYGADGDPALLDGWGQPIVLQIPDVDAGTDPPTDAELEHARLVSAGPDGAVDTPWSGALFASRAASGDDLVLFLRMADPRPETGP